MIDPLFARAQLAIEESQTIRDQRRSLMRQHGGAISELRRTIMESASVRTEVGACREDRE